MICLKLATRTGSFQVEVDATPADCGVANINYERKPLAVPGTWNTGTNYADSRYQLPQIDRDQGSEMACHKAFSVATNCPVFFCDPGSPWQRGTNENTNGLLRQYFPKGTDLSVHSAADLEFVAMQLNRRPRKTLGFQTPAEKMAALINSTET